MTKFGQVTAYDPSTGMATIQYTRPDACEKCGACGGKAHEGTITLKADCETGSWVKVEMPDSRFLHATALAYLIPLCCFFAGLLLGYLLSAHNEIIALLCSLIGLGASLLFLRVFDRRIAGKSEWSPRVAAVYSSNPTLSELHCSPDRL